MTAELAPSNCCAEHSATTLEIQHINSTLTQVGNDHRQLVDTLGSIRTVAVEAQASAASAHHRLNKLDEYYQQAVETNIQLKHFTEAVKDSMASHKEVLDGHGEALAKMSDWKHEHEKAAGNWWVKLMTHGATSFVGALAAALLAYLAVMKG